MRISLLLTCACLLVTPRTVIAQSQALPIHEDLRIGVVAGPDYLQFHQVGGVAIRSNGNIIVLDNGNGEVRVFSEKGDLVRRFGRQGDGPGEFRPPAWMCTGEEHVVVMDQNARATFFRMDGTTDYTVTLYGPGRPSISLIAQSPRGWLATVRDPGAARPELGLGEMWQDSVSVHLIHPETNSVGALVLRYPGRRVVGMPRGASYQPLFSSDPVVGVDGTGQLYVTDGNAYRITVYDPSGAVTRVIEPAHTQRPVEKRYVDRYAELVRDMFAGGDFWNPELQMKNMIDDRIASGHPDYLPAIGDILVARSGALWVERIDVMDDPGAWEFRRTFPPVNANQGGSRPPATVWDVFDAAGNLRGSVSLPDRFKAYAAGDDAVVGVYQDEMDVEYVVRFKIGNVAGGDQAETTGWPNS